MKVKLAYLEYEVRFHTFRKSTHIYTLPLFGNSLILTFYMVFKFTTLESILTDSIDI